MMGSLFRDRICEVTDKIIWYNIFTYISGFRTKYAYTLYIPFRRRASGICVCCECLSLTRPLSLTFHHLRHSSGPPRPQRQCRFSSQSAALRGDLVSQASLRGAAVTQSNKPSVYSSIPPFFRVNDHNGCSWLIVCDALMLVRPSPLPLWLPLISSLAPSTASTILVHPSDILVWFGYLQLPSLIPIPVTANTCSCSFCICFPLAKWPFVRVISRVLCLCRRFPHLTSTPPMYFQHSCCLLEQWCHPYLWSSASAMSNGIALLWHRCPWNIPLLQLR